MLRPCSPYNHEFTVHRGSVEPLPRARLVEGDDDRKNISTWPERAFNRRLDVRTQHGNVPERTKSVDARNAGLFCASVVWLLLHETEHFQQLRSGARG